MGVPYKKFSTGHLMAPVKSQDNLLTGVCEDRDAITFSFSGSALVQIAIGNQALTGAGDPNAIIAMAIGGTPLIPVTLTKEIHGDCVERDWHCWVSAAGPTIGILETLKRGSGNA